MKGKSCSCSSCCNCIPLCRIETIKSSSVTSDKSVLAASLPADSLSEIMKLQLCGSLLELSIQFSHILRTAMTHQDSSSLIDEERVSFMLIASSKLCILRICISHTRPTLSVERWKEYGKVIEFCDGHCERGLRFVDAALNLGELQ